MFHSRKGAHDIKKQLTKFLDPKKDTHARLRVLKGIIDQQPEREIKTVFKSHYTEIYYVFHEEFTNIESSLKSKGHKSQKDDLEGVLCILESLLLYVPNKIHQKWQFNSIGIVLCKVLHHGNMISLREQGIRLFMLWLQALQENADEFCLLLYGSLIPGFPSPLPLIDNERGPRSKKFLENIYSVVSGVNFSAASSSQFLLSLDGESDWCCQEKFTAMLPPAQGEKNPFPLELTKKFLDRILDYMTRKMLDMQWPDKRMRESGFFYLFEHFKKFYLPHIFSHWSQNNQLYEDNDDILQVPLTQLITNKADNVLNSCRRAVLYWLIAFTVRLKIENYGSPGSNTPNESTVTDNHSQSDSSSTSSQAMSSASVGEMSPVSKQYQQLCEAAEIVRSVLYATQDNVLCIHEILKQGFLMPLQFAETISHVLSVYFEWLKPSGRPLFMRDPMLDESKVMETEDAQEPTITPSFRSTSYKQAVQNTGKPLFGGIPVENVRAGLQANLRIFMIHSAQVFFSSSDEDMMTRQVEICRRVMKMYRSIILEMKLTSQTWRQMLVVLLRIVEHSLPLQPPIDRHQTVGGRIASYVLETLFVSWIRASLQVYIPAGLWNELHRIVSSLTRWNEVISQWANTVETLLRVMSRTLYGIDLNDPPLARLTEQKRKRLRGKNFQENRISMASARSSFSRGWSRIDQAEKDSNSDQIVSPSTTDSATVSTDNVSVESMSRQHSESLHSSGDMITLKEAFLPIEKSKRATERRPTLIEIAETTQSIGLYQEGVLTSPISTMGSSTDSYRNPFTDLQHKTSNPVADALAKRQESMSICSSASEESYSLGLSTGSHQLRVYSVSQKTTSLARGSAESPLFFDNETLVKSSSSVSPHGLVPLRQPDVIPVHVTRTDCMSDPDLISLEGQTTFNPRPMAADNQSIDSRMFTFFDGESYAGNQLNVPHGVMATDSVSEAENAEDDDQDEDGSLHCSNNLLGVVTQQSPHVHFEEDIMESSSHGSIMSPISSEDMYQMEHEEPERSVILPGGDAEGWTPASAVILWKRILGALGNINKITDANIHAKVFNYLIQFWEMLYTIQSNLGISIDNKSTPPPPELKPPTFIFLNWCFEASSTSFSVSHKNGRVMAYKLMCMSVLNRADHPISEQQLAHFYRLIHIGLSEGDQNVINAIIAQSPFFFSTLLPGSYLLLLDFITACNSIVSSQSFEYPRKEAVTLLGSLLSFSYVYKTISFYQPGSMTEKPKPSASGSEIVDKVITLLINASKHDPTCQARCLAINSLGVFIITSLTHKDKQPKIIEAICILLASLTFHHRSVANVALGVIWSLHEFTQNLQELDRGLPLRLVEALCSTVINILAEGKGSSSDSPRDTSTEFLGGIILCILDWVLTIPIDLLLTKRRDGDESSTYLAFVFQTLKRAADDVNTGRLIERRRSLNVTNIVLGDTDNRPIRLARVEDHHCVGDRDSDLFDDSDNDDFLQMTIETKRRRLLRLTSVYAINEIVHQLNHFPLNTGAVRIDSIVMENDEGLTSSTTNSQEGDDLTQSLFTQNNIQFLMLNATTLLSVVEIPLENLDTNDDGLCCCKTQCRLILRDLCGKYCWDVTPLYRAGRAQRNVESIQGQSTVSSLPKSPHRRCSQVYRASTGRSIDAGLENALSWNDVKSSATPTSDVIDLMLRYIGCTSPECLIVPDQPLNIPSGVPHPMKVDTQSSVVTAVLKQHNEEENYVHDLDTDPRIEAPEVVPPTVYQPSSPFHNSRSLLHQLGYLSWDKRKDVDLLSNSEKLLREIKNLDNRPSRETHKFAVFYISPGQEDKLSILSNVSGSRSFEEFVSGLGWEVDLAIHTGFMGGLERNLTTGITAPYYASPTLQVIYHVSTRMPVTDGDDSINKKLRHLGNDEVHIIWSEHSRDFRRGIINTEFGDVLIVIYPIGNDLYRIQIHKKAEVPYFGPLFDGAIVDRKCLSHLVRCTAINAGRTKRLLLPLFERHYEDRARCLREIAETQRQPTTFEEFAGRIFNPSLQPEDPVTSDDLAYLNRTFSLPARPSTSSDPSMMLRAFDSADSSSYRIRSSSAVGAMSSGSGGSPVPSRRNRTDSPPTDAEKHLLKDIKKRSLSVRSKPVSQRPMVTTQSASMDV